jgi:hypothetical protein
MCIPDWGIKMKQGWMAKACRAIQLVTICVVCINPLIYGEEGKFLSIEETRAVSIFTININI